MRPSRSRRTAKVLQCEDDSALLLISEIRNTVISLSRPLSTYYNGRGLSCHLGYARGGLAISVAPPVRSFSERKRRRIQSRQAISHRKAGGQGKRRCQREMPIYPSAANPSPISGSSFACSLIDSWPGSCNSSEMIPSSLCQRTRGMASRQQGRIGALCIFRARRPARHQPVLSLSRLRHAVTRADVATPAELLGTGGWFIRCDARRPSHPIQSTPHFVCSLSGHCHALLVLPFVDGRRPWRARLGALIRRLRLQAHAADWMRKRAPAFCVALRCTRAHRTGRPHGPFINRIARSS